VKAARIIRKAVFEMRPIVIRHHNDCDGISGALLIRKAVSELMEKENFDQEVKRKLLYTNQNNSAVYETGDALKDISIFRGVESNGRPLIVLIDFSSNSDSVDSLSLLRGANFEIVLIDHHPPDVELKGYVDCFLSPWMHSGNSHYSAGFLAGEVAKKVSNIKAAEIQTLALIGDRSQLIDFENQSEELKRKALFLDFLGTYSKFPNTLEFYESVLYNQKIIDSLYGQAMSKIEASKKIAMEYLKIKDLGNGFKLCLVRLDRAVKKGEFPGKGKLTSHIHDELKVKFNAPLITVGYGGTSINFRANKEAKENGFDANKIIVSLKNELKNAIASGGGHDVAAGIKVNRGFGKIVLEEIVKNIEMIKNK
jgi:RecJ-like exonuclease